MAVQLSIKPEHRVLSNLVMKQLVESDFKVWSFKSVNNDSIFVMIDMNRAQYWEEADEIQFPSKLLKYSVKVAFK